MLVLCLWKGDCITGSKMLDTTPAELEKKFNSAMIHDRARWDRLHVDGKPDGYDRPSGATIVRILPENLDQWRLMK